MPRRGNGPQAWPPPGRPRPRDRHTTGAVADATVAVEAAAGVEAERYATFEYVSAVEYLRKAREEEGYSDFQQAINLAQQARTFAEEAKTRALANPDRPGAKPAAPVTPAPRPAARPGSSL